MKTRQEYFEEMAKDVRKFGTECYGEHCLSCSIVEKCFAYYFSKVAYHFGYRKASDVVDEFKNRILNEANLKLVNLDGEHKTIVDLADVLKIAAEMKQEVEK